MIAKTKTTNVYPNTISIGNKISLLKEEYPFTIFWMNIVAFLNGRQFINLIIIPSNPSIGNHIPDNTDWPTITIDDIPPIDFSLANEPNKRPNAINNNDVKILPNTANIKFMLISPGSKIIPTTKNKIDWIIVIGKTANA